MRRIIATALFILWIPFRLIAYAAEWYSDLDYSVVRWLYRFSNK